MLVLGRSHTGTILANAVTVKSHTGIILANPGAGKKSYRHHINKCCHWEEVIQAPYLAIAGTGEKSYWHHVSKC